MRFIFATWPDVEYQAVVLTHEGVQDRLLSYAFTIKLKKGELDEYVKKGHITKRKRK